MTALNKQALRELAVALDGDDWHAEGNSVYGGRYDVGDSVCYDHIASCESVNGESPHADFIAAANPATVLSLLDELEAAVKQNAQDVQIKARLCRESNSLHDRLRDAEKRIAELEHSETQLINERDSAESALNDAYKAVMGQAPEWSNWFGFESAIDEIELACEQWRNQTDDVIQFRQRIQELEAREVTLPPTFWYEHDDLSSDIPVLDKRLVEKAIRAAGIGVKEE